MWFRNLQLYRLTQPFNFTSEELDEQLRSRPSRECGALQPFTLGWERPLGRHGTLLTHGVAHFVMVCARKQEKVLPAAVIRERLESKISALEEQAGRKVRRRERLEIKDELMLDLLPRAFTRSSLTYAYIDLRDGWLVIDAASVKKAEELIGLLRETLGTLPLRPVAVNRSPADTMTRWLKGSGLPPSLSIGDECELRDPSEEGGVVRCRYQDLGGEEIGGHLRAGKQVARLALEWQQRIALVLSTDMAIRRLKFLEVIQEEAAENGADDHATRFDADFAMMTLELSRFIPSLLDCFGGLAEESQTP